MRRLLDFARSDKEEKVYPPLVGRNDEMTKIDTQGNITHIKGDTFALTFSEVKLDGVTIDFTDYTIKFVVKDSSRVNTILSLTEADGIDITTNGQIALEASAAIMAEIPAKNYIYDLEVTDADGNVDTWFNGKKFTILQDVA